MESTPGSDDEAARRLARRRLEQLDDYEAALRHAEHIRSMSAPEMGSLGRQLDEVAHRRHHLTTRAEGHLTPRWRATQTWGRWDEGRPRSRVFIDETGLTRGLDPQFPFFAVGAVIIRDEDIPKVEQEIREWQMRWFSKHRYVHEMDVRRRVGAFYFRGDVIQQEKAHRAYRQLLAELPYSIVAVVVDKRELQHLHPDGNIDGYLPGRLYPLTVQMLFERVVHCLYADGDRLGLVEAEGLGEKEDALLLQAYASLRLTGTRYLSERWFRYQLDDAIRFFGKVHNHPGLQLADWIVRPCAEAVAFAKRTPDQGGREHDAWASVRPHLYDGAQGRPDKFGLKIYPSASADQRRITWPGLPIDDEVDWDPRKLKGRTRESDP